MNDRFLSARFHEMREQQLILHRRAMTATDRRVSQIVLDAALRAIHNVQSGISAPHIQAVPLGTGLGKSSSAYALIAAFALADPHFSAAYVVPTIKMGIEAQEGIEALLGEGRTTLWTSLHKHKGVDRTRAYDELGFVPERTVDKATLGAQRVIIVTHSALRKELESGKADGVLHFLSRPRSVVFIDEHPGLVQQLHATPGAVQCLHDTIMCRDPEHPWLPVMVEAMHAMNLCTHGTGQRYIPANIIPADFTAVLAAEDVSLWELTDPETSDDVRRAVQEKFQQVLDFLRAAAQGRAFYSRKECQFFAYSLNLGRSYPGFVLLDATTELAGLVTLNPHVRTVPVVPVNYERLQVLSVDMPAQFRKRVQDVLRVAVTSREYGQFIKESVLANTQAGDDVLVIVHKDVLSMELIGIASEDPSQPIDWDGRAVNTLNWGTGVGSNKFRDKTHVFMFGTFYQPRSATVAQTHAWSQQPLSAEKLVLAEGVPCIGARYAPRGDYRQVHAGIALRWVKQLAMRGAARSVDGEGKCLSMKLFLTLEPELLIPNMGRLFPRAPMPIPAERPAYLSAKPLQGRQGLLYLAMQSKRPYISAEDIKAATGIETSKLSREFKEMEDTLLPLGWSLRSAKELQLAGRMKYLVHNERFLQGLLLAA